jgi:hypothetical protein
LARRRVGSAGVVVEAGFMFCDVNVIEETTETVEFEGALILLLLTTTLRGT